MKINVERGAFLKALGHVQSVVERRNTIPILSNVLIQAAKGQVKLTATDLDIEIVESLPADVLRNGSATAPEDYSARSGTLNFADGQTTKTFTIPITNDGTAEPNESLTVTFSNPTGGVVLGTATALVSITDNDANPDQLEFEAGSYTETENGVFLDVVVRRFDNGLSTETGSVTFTASNGTAGMR